MKKRTKALESEKLQAEGSLGGENQSHCTDGASREEEGRGMGRAGRGAGSTPIGREGEVDTALGNI